MSADLVLTQREKRIAADALQGAASGTESGRNRAVEKIVHAINMSRRGPAVGTVRVRHSMGGVSVARWEGTYWLILQADGSVTKFHDASLGTVWELVYDPAAFDEDEDEHKAGDEGW